MAAASYGSDTQEANALAQQFGDLVRSLANDSTELTRMVSLKALLEDSEGADQTGRKKWLADLATLQRFVDDVERRLAAARVVIAGERNGVAQLDNMLCEARKQEAHLHTVSNSLPRHLPGGAPAQQTAPELPSDVARADQHPQDDEPTLRTSLAPGSKGVPVMDLVTAGELGAVPKTTRARLTLEQVNAAVTEIQAAAEGKYALLSRPRGRLSDKLLRKCEELERQAVKEHSGAPFISDADLRGCLAFKKGEATVRALVNTLRHLKRVKSVHGSGSMTYVLVGRS